MNKTLLKNVCKQFREWVHSSGDKEDKLRLVRTLTSENEAEKEMLTDARSHVGAALVAYARGNPEVKTVKPYGLKASRSTKIFKSLPSTTLSLTFAAMYQVVRIDSSTLDKWIKTPRPSITLPWSRGMIKRFVQLGYVFGKNRAYVFQDYERDGGEYMSDEEEDVEDDTTTPVKKTTVDDFEEDFA